MTTPALRGRMTSMDASFLYFERPEAPLHIGSTTVVEGELSREALLGHMSSRLHRIPRYRQLASFDPLKLGHPLWEEDAEFELLRHVSEVRLAEGCTHEEIMQAIADIAAPMLPRDRPLWKMALVHGLPGGNTGVISLVHHCMVDGVSGIELLNAITDLSAEVEPDAPVAYAPVAPLAPFDRARAAWFDSVQARLTASTDLMRRAADPQQAWKDWQTFLSSMNSAAPQLLTPAPATPFNRPITGARNYSYLDTSFADIRGVRAALGGTINDVVLTTLAGGLGKYMRGLGGRTEGVELRAMVPVNVRSEADKTALGNQVSMLIAPLPVGVEDPAARHAMVISRMNGLKAANQAGGFALATQLADILPPALQAMAALFVPPTQPLFNIVCTNVPGPQVPLYMAGHKVLGLWPIVPLSMGLGLNTALTSYNGHLYWGFCADPNLVPDVGKVSSAVGEAFEELMAAAGSTAAA